MVTIVPAILEKDISSFEEKLKKVWGITKRVQMDIIDGKFAPTETVMPEILLNIDTIVDFEGQLMVDKPEEWVDRCAAAGMTALYGHVEKMEDRAKFIADTEAAGMKAGLAFDIDTPLDGLEEMINSLDGVLLMSVKAGSQGVQKFDERVLSKIKKVRGMSEFVKIVVDGGLNVENIKKCLVAEWAQEIAEDEFNKSFLGMEFAVGSDLLGAENVEEELKRLESLGAV
ncbi:MAG: Ribulose-phosphate 3-epimerase [Candidatus Collierbacteria bacterium GW2011_GWC2_44_18]|uniref:Ribulose-phosphate 3-epimerase n=2 Tax=Microgenomates group TaxID=1794810 RepID=A0A0G1J8V3_9BACT|nr:MAG: Ribulose-phosphate 3-epimerase [Microgenomates group bacterium GW2011_GWC1_44_10]KKT49871.1 MAG: Ribulose-phosphate 3-epimerase [Candidatus Collierbacteria bacterium GW2011_GWC2_44_18]KKT67680.1 MAG: Ribulose-phosphate 3-epimerase [Candidatus Woesebacteria bacterium GW2011_GWA2_44_33]